MFVKSRFLYVTKPGGFLTKGNYLYIFLFLVIISGAIRHLGSSQRNLQRGHGDPDFFDVTHHRTVFFSSRNRRVEFSDILVIQPTVLSVRVFFLSYKFSFECSYAYTLAARRLTSGWPDVYTAQRLHHKG